MLLPTGTVGDGLMAIKGAGIRSIEKVIAQAKGANRVRFVLDNAAVSRDALLRIGFDGSPRPGDRILPPTLGKVTTFNANGREIVRRDLPMEKHSVGSFRSWKDWHGQTHSGIQFRDVKAYPRDWLRAPAEELTVVEFRSKTYISTREVALKDEAEDQVRHLANLMLECFESFDVLDVSSGLVVQQKVRNLGWDILPPGKYPWATAEPLLRAVTRTLNDATRPVAIERLQTISGYQPSFLARGRAGFDGYVVFGFPERNLYVLESTNLDNATYVFTENWEALSQFTKADIIQGDLAKQRIIHGRQWRGWIHALLGTR
jgi:hypothetical protein